MDATDPHTLSEPESLSDSDWLDIASSRASEDTDSVVGFDSDRELDSQDDRPPSRHSFSSTNSSHTSEVQAWEGLIEDIPDERHTATLPLTRPSALSSSAPAGGVAPAAQQADPEEEQRVKDALDQSMMSTLSSSRSNTLSGSHSSLVRTRDLRLSFPDPLTSSRDEPLNDSYEAVAPPSVAEVDASPAVLPGADSSPRRTADIDAALAPTAADPGSLATPAVPDAEESSREDEYRPDLYVVLYGSSSGVKWSLIDKLLEKAAVGMGLTLTSRIVGLIDGYVRFLSSNGGQDNRTVWVIDRTDSVDTSSFVPFDRPSLAVVFLPSPLTFVPDHSLYLPVLAHSPSVIDIPFSADQLLDAEQQWDTFNVPQRKVVPVSRCSSSVVDVDEIERVAPKQLARALRPLFAGEVRQSPRFTQRIASKHAFTILAILSVVLGYAIKGSFTPSATPTVVSSQPQQTTPTFAFPPVSVPINHSTPQPSLNPATSGLVRSSLKDFALAVLPAPLVASTSTSQPSAMPSPHHADPVTSVDAPSECACGCGLITWPGKSKGTTDLMLRPTPATSAVHDAGKSSLAMVSSHSGYVADGAKGKAVARGDDTMFALSAWRGAGSLAEILGLGYTAVARVVAQDVQEIMDALDELARAIGRQSALVWAQSAGAVQGLKTMIHARHERARARAMELRRMGGRLFESVQEKVKGRVNRARENARASKDEILTMDAWPVRGRQMVESMTARRLAQERRAHRKARTALTH
ncbi:uncharacterized protein B0H18DRAFT_1117987 [Fomitopsis serialis]|uniref:uncharacterized protein n=1 Tax=Fomitopsis serialis TaxID=139415 RepID=UPI002007CBC6|nr:uncharacterized protein B0H18DRAFT_1117987 [Neoantrodia serialis]KAH9928305.1 hypothetical protein B0H18DRAFT_1117987 [Neoantrodia serialis]